LSYTTLDHKKIKFRQPMRILLISTVEIVEGVILTLLKVNGESALQLKNQTIWMQSRVGCFPPKSLCSLPTSYVFI